MAVDTPGGQARLWREASTRLPNPMGSWLCHAGCQEWPPLLSDHDHVPSAFSQQSTREGVGTCVCSSLLTTNPALSSLPTRNRGRL